MDPQWAGALPRDWDFTFYTAAVAVPQLSCTDYFFLLPCIVIFVAAVFLIRPSWCGCLLGQPTLSGNFPVDQYEVEVSKNKIV